MKQVILHIGPPKTGSTTIQSFLALNEDVLRRDHGVNVVTVGRGWPRQNVNLAWELISQDRFEPNLGGWTEAVAEIHASACDRHILTAETFSNFKPRHLARVAEQLSGFEVLVVFYARRPDTWIESVYVQNLKKFSTDFSPDAFIEERLAGADSANIGALLDRWAAVFGESSIRLRVLEEGQLVGGDLVGDFRHVAGLDDLDLEPLGRSKNETPGARTIDALHLFNTALRRSGKDLAFKQKLAMKEAIRSYGARAGWNEERARIIPGDLALSICERFHEDHAHAARRYLGREDGVLFRDLPQPGGGLHAALPGRLTLDDMADLIIDLRDAELDR